MKTIIKKCNRQLQILLIRLFLVVILGMLLSSCEKALEPNYPDFLLSEDALFENTATIDAAIANIYAGIRDISPVNGGVDGMGILLGLYTDELDYYRENAPIDNAFYNHSVLPNNTAVSNFWNNSYSLIYSINKIVEGLEKAPLEEDQLKGYRAEAIFLRAYLHFYLVQLFGDIPYIKSTDYKKNASVSRMPTTEVYQIMVEDLLEARTLLPYMETTGEKTKVSKGVASAMLARVYLFTQQWEKAVVESTSVLNEGTYSWQQDLNQVFLKESPSTIWQLKPEFEGAGTKEGQTLIFDFGPPFLYALTDNFISGFKTDDLRKEAWTREISDGMQSWNHPYKYKQNYYEGNSTEYSILFRLAELFLIRAEANLQLGNLQLAKDDIDIIRHRAGLIPTIASSSEEISIELRYQWQYEFFSEQGHRWLDLKRSGSANEVLAPIKPGWKATDVLFPLPANELILNPNLNPQNPGY